MDVIVPGGNDRSVLVTENLEIARMVFGKWCIEIFAVLSNFGPIGFEELRRRLGGISARVLSRKLQTMEAQGFVERTLVDTRPPRATYSLTETGRTVVEMGTPLFLFLSYWRHSTAKVPDERLVGQGLIRGPRLQESHASRTREGSFRTDRSSD
ncbi:MAG TPA: helix-turn-helix domain-containing protein [Thermoplasmata archaeon]|nr:helix-turn-helix domain-containing protein [Thermoplasmata archaeon]